MIASRISLRFPYQASLYTFKYNLRKPKTLNGIVYAVPILNILQMHILYSTVRNKARLSVSINNWFPPILTNTYWFLPVLFINNLFPHRR